jgi:hypothetical protein
VKLRFHNKVAALEQLMRHQGGFAEDDRQKGDAIDALLGQIPRENLLIIEEHLARFTPSRRSRRTTR